MTQLAVLNWYQFGVPTMAEEEDAADPLLEEEESETEAEGAESIPPAESEEEEEEDDEDQEPLERRVSRK